MVRTKASNHCSSCIRLRPRGSARIPIYSSPRIMESTTMSCSLALSQSITLRLGRRSRRFAEHVRVDEVNHPSLGALRSSVVSVRSMGWNQPLAGQASSSFTRPSLRRRSFRLSRYSPRSSRSTSNSWPASMPSCFRISAGNTISAWTRVARPGPVQFAPDRRAYRYRARCAEGERPPVRSRKRAPRRDAGRKLSSPKRSGTAAAGVQSTALEPRSSRAGTMVKARAAARGGRR